VVTGHFGGVLEQIIQRGAARVSVACSPFTIVCLFLVDISSLNMNAAIAKLDRALIFFHASAMRPSSLITPRRFSSPPSILTMRFMCRG